MSKDDHDDKRLNYVAEVLHEIRTPLNAIVGLCDLLGTTDLDAEQAKYTDAMHTSLEHINDFLNKFLDYSKVVAGKFEIEHSSFNLRGLVEDVVAFLGILAKRKGLILDLSYDRTLPTWVTGDPTRLNQVLTNLIGNAIKFTSSGRVTLRVLTQLPQELILFEVQDGGEGVSKEAERRIFEEFTQASAATARTHGGTGLGLSISKKLVDLMGGHIGVRNVPTGGCIFHFTAELPACASADTEEEKSSPVIEDRPVAVKGMKILIADDNHLNQTVMQRMVLKCGHRADIVGNGREMLDAIKDHDYDLILMDCAMPVMDGFEATRELRKLAGPKGLTPVIAVSANNWERERCFDAGMNDHLPKPIKLDAMSSTLANWSKN